MQAGPEKKPLVGGFGGFFCDADNGEIAGAGANVEFAHAFGFGGHHHTAEARLGGGLGGVVAEGVLVANVSGDFSRNLVNLFDRLGEERYAAGFSGEHFEGAMRVADFLPAHLITKKEADGVDDWPGELLDAPDGLLKVEGRGIVFAVGDEDEDLFWALGIGDELVRGGYDGVVERGAAAGFDMAEAVAKLVDVGGKLLVNECLVREVHDKGFVLGI